MFRLLHDLMNSLMNPIYSTEITGGGTPGSKSIDDNKLSVQDMINEMDKDDEVKDEEPELELEEDDTKDSKSKKDDKEDKEEDEEEEREEKEEDELDEIEKELNSKDYDVHQAVTRREILKAFPDIFKKFPELETTIGRENAFSKIFPTTKEAESAKEAANTINLIEADISKGNVLPLMSLIKNNKLAFDNLVDNYLPNLFQVDKDAYFTVYGNLIKDTVKNMATVARRDNNKELGEVAEGLYKFIFGHTNWEEPVKLSKGEVRNEEEERLENERKQFAQERFDNAKSEIDTKIESVLKRTIEKYIDPKESMTSYVRRTASKEALDDLIDKMNSDERLQPILDRLWKDAASNNYSLETKNKILTALKSTASKYAIDVVKKARAVALKENRSSVKKDGDEDRPLNKGKANPSNRSDSPSRGSRETIKERASKIPAHMTSEEYLNS